MMEPKSDIHPWVHIGGSVRGVLTSVLIKHLERAAACPALPPEESEAVAEAIEILQHRQDLQLRIQELEIALDKANDKIAEFGARLSNALEGNL